MANRGKRVHGQFEYADDVEPLRIPVEWTAHCPKCDGDFRFYADRQCATGLIGTCMNCGDERIAPWTRTTPEVA